MARRLRADAPGAWHHVFNRAIARRTLFETREDFRYFQACLAKEVHRGTLEVHAFVLMSTHYHLLVRSPNGRLSEAMHRVQSAYSRYFNRKHKRDGTLMRGRFGSLRVKSMTYRRNLVRYIDVNVTRPRLVAAPEEYPWCSAVHHSGERGPIWLERSWIQEELQRDGGVRPYRQAFPVARTTALIEVVEARMARGEGRDNFDDIVGAADPATRNWMVKKAILADGTLPGLPVLAISPLEAEIAAGATTAWEVPRGRSKRSGWQLARVGLGRDLAGESYAQISRRLRISLPLARRIYEFHRAEMDDHTPYAQALVDLASRCLPGPHYVRSQAQK